MCGSITRGIAAPRRWPVSLSITSSDAFSEPPAEMPYATSLPSHDGRK